MWSKERKLKFVQECVKFRCLFASRNETKGRKFLRNEALMTISRRMNIPGFGPREVYTKLRNLRSTYLQEVKKIRYAKEEKGYTYVSNLVWFETFSNALKIFRSKSGTTAVINNDVDPFEETYEDTEEHGTFSRDNVTNPAPEYKLEFTGDDISIDEPELEKNTAVYLTEDWDEKQENRTMKRKIAVKKDSYEIQLKNNDVIANDVVGKNEFDVFGESVAAQLKRVPLADALEAQKYIQNYLSDLRLQLLKHESSE